MNATLNIVVRVASQQALAQMKQLNASTAGLNATANATAGGGLARMGNWFRAGHLEKWSKNLQWTGRQLQYNFTLPLLLAAGAATKWELEAERAMTRVKKVYGSADLGTDVIQSELHSLETTFRLLSDRFGVHRDEVIEIASAWAQAGSSGLGLARAVRLTLETMILGEMDAVEAQKGLIAIQSTYRLSTQQLRLEIARLNVIENETSISFQGLIQVVQRAGGSARAAGIDISHLAAMAASLVPATGEAAQAGNALRTVISRIMAPTTQAANVMARMGIDIYDASWQALNGVGRIEKMAEAFDGLTQSQKTVVSAFVASRWQVSRFEVLMEDITNRNGAYQKALEISADKTEVLSRYTNELTTYLGSTPQAFKILTTQLQNAMATAIIPLLPAMLALLSRVVGLVRAFTDLSPATQQMILGFLVLLALVGPVVKLIGGIGLLASTAVGAFLGLKTALFGVSTASVIAGMATQGMTVAEIENAAATELNNMSQLKRHGILKLLLLTLWKVASFPFRVIGFGLEVMWAVGIAGGKAFLLGLQGVWAAVAPLMSAIGGVIASGLQLGWMAAQAAWAPIRAGFMLIWSGLTQAMAIIGISLSFALQSGWMVAQATFKKIAAIFMAIWSVLGPPLVAIGTMLGTTFSAAVAAGMALMPESIVGIVLVAAVGLGLIFRNQIASAIDWLIGKFYQLPDGVVNAFRAVVRIVEQAAMAVYDWLQYMNPFARHSPSLVDNVSAGVRQILASYSQLRAVPNVIRAAARAHQVFRDATRPAANKMAAADLADKKASVLRAAPDAGPAFDRQVGAISSLKRQLDLLSPVIMRQGTIVQGWEDRLNRARRRVDMLKDALDKATDALATLSSTPIAGMRVMEDAIFSNEMAQKRLRLEMLRIEEVSGPIQDIQARLSALRGEIEMLTADREQLRMGGAGSDVLATYDAQIAAIEAESDSLEGASAQANEMQRQMAELQRQGEILDLEKSLHFDPLLRQIEQVTNSMTEMPFDELFSKIVAQQDRVNSLTSAYNSANATFDATQARYDAEKAKLDALNTTYDNIEAQIREMEAAINDFAAASDAAFKKASDAAATAKIKPEEKLFDAAAAGDFPIPGGTDVVGREAGDIDAYNAQLEEELKRASEDLGKIDMFGPIKDMWNSAWAWVVENVGPVLAPVGEAMSGWFKDLDLGGGLGDLFGDIDLSGMWTSVSSFLDMVASWGDAIWPVLEEIGGWFVSMGKDIGEELGNWGELWEPFLEACEHMWNAMVNGLKIALAVVAGVVALLWPIIKHALVPILNWLGEAIAAALQVVRGVIGFVLNLINGDWSAAWDSFLTILDGVWDLIWSTIKNAMGLVWGVIKGTFESIINAAKWLWDVLVGHSIIPDIVNGIIFYFRMLASIVVPIFQAIVAALVWAWENIGVPLFHAVAWYVTTILIPAFQMAWDVVSVVWSALWTAVTWAWENLGKPIFSAIKWAIQNLVIPAFQFAWAVITTAWKAIWTLIQFWWNTIGKPIFDMIKWVLANVVIPAFQFLWTTVQTVWNNIRNAISTAWSAVKTVWQAMKDGVRTFIVDPFVAMKDRVVGIFNTIKDTAGSVWDAVKRTFKSGVNGAINPINSLIGGVNRVKNVLGLSLPNIPDIPTFAKGGAIPTQEVGNGFVAKGARAIVGEGSKVWPEFVIPTDPRHRGRAIKLFDALGTRLVGGRPKDRGGFNGDPGDFPMYGIGGILGGAVDWVSTTAADAASAVASAGREAAVAAIFGPINALVDRATNAMGDSGVPGVLGHAIRKFKDMIYDWAAGKEAESTGVSPEALERAMGFAKAQSGKPYKWGAVGPEGYDCSGFWSAIINVLQNNPPHSRLFTSATLVDSPPGYLDRGAGGPMAVAMGARKGNPGHVAGNMGGINFESTGDHVRYGASARGATAAMFTNQYHVRPGALHSGGIVGGSGEQIRRLLEGEGVLQRSAMKAIGHQNFMELNSGRGEARDSLNRRDVTQSTTNNFYGDLVFPNIKTGDDAKDFLSNLDALVDD